jgi:hypothetical protein
MGLMNPAHVYETQEDAKIHKGLYCEQKEERKLEVLRTSEQAYKASLYEFILVSLEYIHKENGSYFLTVK